MQNWIKEWVFGQSENGGMDIIDKLRKTHAKTCIKDLFSYLKNMCLGCVFEVLLQG